MWFRMLVMIPLVGLILFGCDDESDAGLSSGGLVSDGTMMAVLNSSAFTATEVLGSRSSEWQFIVMGEGLLDNDTVMVTDGAFDVSYTQ